MGKKMDAFLGRSSFNTLKFSGLVHLAISRLAVLKTRGQARYSQATSDVVQLLQLGQHERSLYRVEQVIKEQNMLDAYAMMDSYVALLLERLDLIEQARICPDELKEAVASLIYASSRCGDFPELQEIRAVFASHYGKEFVSSAIELRNNCKVNPKMIRKLSTRPPELESKMKLLKEIASQNKITLQFEEISSWPSIEEEVDGNDEQNQLNENQSTNSGSTEIKKNLPRFHEVVNHEFSESTSTTPRRKYKDVADAAQAAFESAAYAADAARAAVELSKTNHGSNHHKSINTPERRKSHGENDILQSENTKENEKEIVMDKNDDEVQQWEKENEKEIVMDKNDDEVQQWEPLSSLKDKDGLTEIEIQDNQKEEAGVRQHKSHYGEKPGMQKLQVPNKEKWSFSRWTKRAHRG